jgi:rfaE bifunctional protein nucleotidyltransferase chain/domain
MKDLLESKIFSLKLLVALREQWKNEKLKVVLTNGCFDILHEGHVRYLTEAKSKGDRLIVAINTDQSVKILKGSDRPINKEQSRAIVLAGLQSVDAVILFDDNNPLELISILLPDILVKGGDWKPEQIIGSDVVLNHGGQIYSLSFYDGLSTTQIVQKIKNNANGT